MKQASTAQQQQPLSDFERMILRECVKREDEVAAAPKPPEWQRWEVELWEEMQRYGPPYSSAKWFGDERGGLPERVRSRILRTIRELERRDLLEGTSMSGRLRWLRTTEAGRAAVAEA